MINNSLVNSIEWQNYTNQPNMPAENIAYNKAMLSKISALSETNKKICLFIGRCVKEELPHEEGVTWISLDIQNEDPNNLDRLHLIMNCNDKNSLATIKNIFSKVVVDQSTWKFFDPGIIDRLTSLLKIDSQSCLIFESNFQTVTPKDINQYEFDHVRLNFPEIEDINYMNEKEKTYQGFLEKIGGALNITKTNEYAKFISESINQFGEEFVAGSTEEELQDDFKETFTNKHVESPLIKYIPLARQQTLDYLKTLYEQVELKVDTPYPYPTRYSNGHDDFFQAIGRKV